MKFLALLMVCISCSSANLDTEWWKHTNIYELLIQTFKDSNGDGIGDIQGLISTLDHFVDLGIETIYLTPIYKTGFKDMGYDIIDYYDIDPRYGTMEDFDQLMKEINARGMKLMMDLVINHSSNENEWFKKSVEKIDPYTDYYIWKDPIYRPKSNKPDPPNTWRGVFGSGWTYVESRQQYYYHAFLPQQPDFNFRNRNVRREIENMIEFWLDKGIAGFRVDAPMFYIEDEFFRNSGQRTNHKETFEYIHELRLFFDNYNNKHGGFERILAPEPHANPELAQHYLGTKEYPLNHFIFNYYFEYQRQEMKTLEFDYIINSWLSALPPGTVGWVTQDHDQSRTGSRINKDYMDILTITTALLPGVLHLYYGQEIGLRDGTVLSSQNRDFSGRGSRDPNRLVMPWDDSISAGFSSNKNTFSPIRHDFIEYNVKNQKKQEISHYNLLKFLLALRKTDTVKYGDFDSFIYSSKVYLFRRSYKKHSTIITVINLCDTTLKVDLKKALEPLSRIYTVAAASVNSGYWKGDIIDYRDKYEILMRPQSAIVFTTTPGKEYFKKKTS